MIIQVRGTSGTGKSTVVRQVMASFGPLHSKPGTKSIETWKPSYIGTRKRPMCYTHYRRPIVVMGHYERGGGGCDTFKNVEYVFDLTVGLLTDDLHAPVIIMEGLLLSEDSKWTFRLHQQTPVVVFYLMTDMDTCLARLHKRRENPVRKITKPLNENKHVIRHSVIERSRLKLMDAGITCHRVADWQCAKAILKLLDRIANPKSER